MSKDEMKSSRTENFRGPLFVVGMWRSGTSLLYALLNQHPEIRLMYEGDLPLLRSLFHENGSRTDWAERWEFWNSALSRHRINRQGLSVRAANLQAAMEEVYGQYAGSAIWGCKSPNYYDGICRLAEEFPGARFIVIYRSPFDICRSILKAARKSSWFAKTGLPLRALLGFREMKREADQAAARGVRIHQFQYEDMVRDPASEMTRICEFLDIPFDARMTSLEGADRSSIYEAEHHAQVKGKEIVASDKREEILAPAFKGKIQRYLNLWRREFAGKWPLYPAPAQGETDLPGPMERMVDSVTYRFLRDFDRVVASLYCSLPIGLLNSYRNMKPKRADIPATKDALQSARTGLH